MALAFTEHRLPRVLRISALVPCLLLTHCVSSDSGSRFKLTAKHPFYWEIAGPSDVGTVAHLVDSIATLDRRLAPGPSVEAAFKESVSLVLVVNVRDPGGSSGRCAT